MRIRGKDSSYDKPISEVKFHPSGKSFLTLSAADDEIRRWGIVGDTIKPGWSIGGGSPVDNRYIDLAVHPDGARFACVGRDRKLEIRRTVDGRLIAECGRFRKKTPSPGLGACGFIAGGSLLASTTADPGNLEVFDPESGRQLGAVKLWSISSIVPHPEGEIVAAVETGLRSSSVHFLRIASGGKPERVGVEVSFDSLVQDVRFSPKEDYFAAVGGIPPLALDAFHFPSFRRAVRYRVNEDVDPKGATIPLFFKISIDEGEVFDESPLTNGLAFSPDGSGLLCPDFSGDLVEFALGSGEEIGRWRGHDDVATSLDHNRSSTRYVSSGRDGSLILWEREKNARARADEEGRPITADFLERYKIVPGPRVRSRDRVRIDVPK